MAYFESPFSSTSSSYRHRWNYDVFLSFRGEDTRKQFTDHLYSALIQAGIHTFRDDNELPRGEEISPQLLRAIEGSRISVVVFSTNYASSRWCLDELVKIIECSKNSPDIRKQTGSYAKAFDEHEEHFKEEMEKVNRWREALTQAANLSGWGLKNETNGHEAKFIKKVVNDVACKLGNKTLHVAKHPVGISSRVRDVISLLKGARNNVGIVGIYGIAGIGKTTIAKAVFNNLYFRFEGSSFLSGVKEISDKPNGLVELQERLLHDILKPNVWKISNVYEGMNLIKERLHRKNVLVVFDDVNKREQVEALMGERCWFGDGSIIIVVTKNKHLLTEVQVDGMYHAKELNRVQSLQLFSLHAFRETRPAKDYEELSGKVVDYCDGHPLALKILGSHLSIRDKAGWEIDIAHWQNIPHDDIQGKLRVSFDALDVDSSEIFLDIACFFVGQDKDYVTDIVGARYGCHPEVAFRALIGRSLIAIDTENQNRLCMHDIVQRMGREIIRQRSPNHPEKCSRIVLSKDAYTVLSKEMGTDAVEGLALDVQGSFSTKSFTKMTRLQLLQITGAHLVGSYSLLPRELIWLSWLECPLKSLPPDFHLSELVLLDMQKSKVRKLWKGTKILNKLKILNLSYSKCLVKTPNFRGLPSLERLILVECTSLVEVHQSIGNLKSLVLLNLRGCNSLKSLPESMGSLKSLQTLNVTACSQLEKLPESLGDLESLTELVAQHTGIKQLPTSDRYLKKLTKLSFGGYKNVFYSPDPPSKSRFSRFSSWFPPKSCSNSIAMPPASFTGFSSLKDLNLSYAGLSDAISSIDFGSLSFLVDLDLSGNGFFHLPSGISRLSKLQRFTVDRCENLLSISELPPSLLFLSINGCTSIERVSAQTQFEELPILSAKGCQNLIKIQGLEFADNNWHMVCMSMDVYNNLSENYKMSLIQETCKGKEYEIFLAGGEIPEWFSHRGEGSALSFHLPSVSVPDGNKLQALLFWVVYATPQTSSLPYSGVGSTIFKNKSNGIELFETMAFITSDINSSKHSWIQRVLLAGLEESLQGVEELELNFKVSWFTYVGKCWVEKCGVHLIMEKSKADSDIHARLGFLAATSRCATCHSSVHSATPRVTSSQLLRRVTGCCRIKTLPKSICNSKSIETLNISLCSQLERLPEFLGDMEALTELLANGTAIKQLPASTGYLKKLTSCSTSIAMLPTPLTSLTSLKELDLSYCGLPGSSSSIHIGSLSSLEKLNLSGNKLSNLPSSIGHLLKLKDLWALGCLNLIEFRDMELLDTCSSILNFDGCNNLSNNYKKTLVQEFLDSEHTADGGYGCAVKGVEELELNVEISSCEVEQCGVHLIKNNNGDSNIGKLDGDINSLARTETVIDPSHHHQAIASSSPNEWLESCLRRELQRWKICLI
uniref:TIR domain-containing protein n=1 Tax=Salix viminalis TaxID=40686 RepID=A0A6N2KWJ0_SALVM